MKRRDAGEAASSGLDKAPSDPAPAARSSLRGYAVKLLDSPELCRSLCEVDRSIVLIVRTFDDGFPCSHVLFLDPVRLAGGGRL